GLASLPAARVEALFARYPNDVRQAGAAVIEKLNQASKGQRERLTALEAELQRGDPERGREVYFSKTAACAACHRVKGEGGLVGPELSRIGEVRAPRDLLEAIVYPSATFVRGYEPVSIVTIEGVVHAGILAGQAADAVVLLNAQRAEIRIARDEIDELSPGKISIMPQGFDPALTPAQLADLVAYLKTLKG
ncbi:MAG: c-type cytochrome, partial [Planctomycetia bacterium]